MQNISNKSKHLEFSWTKEKKQNQEIKRDIINT